MRILIKYKLTHHLILQWVNESVFPDTATLYLFGKIARVFLSEFSFRISFFVKKCRDNNNLIFLIYKINYAKGIPFRSCFVVVFISPGEAIRLILNFVQHFIHSQNKIICSLQTSFIIPTYGIQVFFRCSLSKAEGIGH